jgi:hypothetical protein
LETTGALVLVMTGVLDLVDETKVEEDLIEELEDETTGW